MSNYEFNDIEAFNATNTALASLEDRFSVIADCNTKDGYEENKAGCRELQKTRKLVDDARKEKTEESRLFTKKVNDEGNRIINVIKEIEAPMIAAKKEVDDREAREKAERIAKLQTKVDALFDFISDAKDQSSETIQQIIESVELIDTGVDFYDLTKEAGEAKAKVLSDLGSMLVSRMDYEANEEKRKIAEAAAEKAAKEKAEIEQKANEEKAEVERKAAIESKINNLKMIPTQFFGKSAKEIDDKISALANYDIYNDKFLFLERTEEAQQAKLQVIAQLGQMLASQKIVEKAAADEAQAKAEKEAETVEVAQSGVVIVEHDDGALERVDITTPLPIDSKEVDDDPQESDLDKDSDSLYKFFLKINAIEFPEMLTPEGEETKQMYFDSIQTIFNR